MAPDRRLARHRAPVAVRPGAEAARYLLEGRRQTRRLLGAAMVAVPLVSLFVLAAPVGFFPVVVLVLAMLLVLCALSQGVRVTVGYGTLLSALVVLMGHRMGTERVESLATGVAMLLLTAAAAGGSRMWAVAHDILAEQLRVSNVALKRANDRLREVNASLEQRVAERTDELRELSRRDELTGLYNRRHFMARLTQAAQGQDEVCVLMIDADNFKAVNDTAGHAAGDRVLQILAATLSRVTRSEDVLARIGGEEFAVLVTGTDGPMVAERVRAGVERVVWPADLALPGGRVTVSVGHACSSGPGAEPSLILQRADAALYASKRAGRNRVTGSPALP